MVIGFALNKKQIKGSQNNKRFDVALTVISRFLLSVWKFQQFARFNSSLIQCFSTILLQRNLS